MMAFVTVPNRLSYKHALPNLLRLMRSSDSILFTMDPLKIVKKTCDR